MSGTASAPACEITGANGSKAAEGETAGFALATVAFLLAFAASNMPVPLYATIQASNPNITDMHVSLTMFAYLMSVVVMLLFSGRLSDAVGRRPLACASMLLGALGCAMFLKVPNAGVLLAARFVQGLSCGLAMGPLSAYIIDLAGTKHDTLARTIVGTFAMLGVAIGSVGIGLWNMAFPNYGEALVAASIAQLACAAAFLLAPETVNSNQRIPLRSVWKSPICIPKAVLPVFPLAAVAYIVEWGMGTYFQAFSSLVALESFGSESTLTAAVILSLSMCPSCLGGPLEARLPKGAGLRAGLVLFLASIVGMCAFMRLGMLLPFLVALAAFSLSMGMALSGSLRILFAADPYAGSSSIISAINLTAYAGCSVMNAGMSALVTGMGIYGTMLAISVVCAAGTIVCLPMERRLRSTQNAA